MTTDSSAQPANTSPVSRHARAWHTCKHLGTYLLLGGLSLSVLLLCSSWWDTWTPLRVLLLIAGGGGVLYAASVVMLTYLACREAQPTVKGDDHAC